VKWELAREILVSLANKPFANAQKIALHSALVNDFQSQFSVNVDPINAVFGQKLLPTTFLKTAQEQTYSSFRVVMCAMRRTILS